MDPSKGLFRRRPSTASTRSRLRGQPSSSSASSSPSMSGGGGSVANVLATNFAQSCPTSPSHCMVSRRSLGGDKIPEDEEANTTPPTTTAAVASPLTTTTITVKAQINNTLTTTTTNKSNNATNNTINANTTTTTTKTTATTTTTTTVTLSPLIATASNSKEAAEYAAAINDAKREREALHKPPPAARMRNPRVSSAGDRLMSSSTKMRAVASTTVTAKQSENDPKYGGVRCTGTCGQAQLQRSASTVSGLTVRPYSSPAGLHAYTGKVPGSVPSSIHGSRLDLRDPDKGSAIYLGCSAPRNSTLSLSSRTSSGSSAPPSPVRTPPVSPRHSMRRAATVVKKPQQHR